MNMSPELGHFALIVAFSLAVLQAVVPLAGSYAGIQKWMQLGKSLSIGHLVFTMISFACLTKAFLDDDFSVAYVVNNSNTILPQHFKVSAVWGAHEGSLLLWALILAGWTCAVAFFCRALPPAFLARVLSVQAMIAVGFGLFLLITSNPFERTLPFPPTEGTDLNPLLQDIGLIIHPPLLYMGYVGFSVPFAFAISALLCGQFDSAWARWCRIWVNAAWAFLTFGIALGSWWAYYELGWGGWWFWDPVENASFLPWLVGTALVHSVAATEKRGVFRSWTLLLAILAFSLSLLGTFLVRSGVLTSVHAFASDPERGIFILIFLALVIIGALLLFALQGPIMKSRAEFSGTAREMFLLANNLILVTAMIMILVGTLYPLVSDVLGLGKVSVGPPYFNFFFVPMGFALLSFLGLSVSSRWRHTEAARIFRFSVSPALLSVFIGGLLPIFFARIYSSPGYSIGAALTLICALWVILAMVQDVIQKLRHRALRFMSGRYWGMFIAHCGIAVCTIGLGLSSIYDSQRDMRMTVGQSAKLADYLFEMRDLNVVNQANYQATRAEIFVSKSGQEIAVLKPEKRRYFSGEQIMTEAAIDPGLTRDLYVALGEPLDSGNWAIRFQVKPFVRWIWAGGFMIGLGALLSLSDNRSRRRGRMFRKTNDSAFDSELGTGG